MDRSVKSIVGLFIGWRLALFLMGYIATAWLPPENFPVATSAPSTKTIFCDIWNYWDSGWFNRIASVGYGVGFEETGNYIIFDFFPLFPFLTYIVSHLIGLDTGISQLIIANLFTLGSCIALYKTASLDLERSQAEKVVYCFLIYPFSLFFAAGYSETIFLFFSILAFYNARKSQWYLAGIFGGLAGLTRFFGVFLFPVLLTEYFSQKKKIRSDIIGLLLIPAGLGIYLAYLTIAYGDPGLLIKSLFASDHNRSTSCEFWRPFSEFIRVASGYPVRAEFILKWAEILSYIFCLYGAIVLLRRYRISYGLYALIPVLFYPLTGTLWSFNRYIIVIFPLYILLARWCEKELFYRIFTIFSIILLTLFALLFTRHYFVG